MTYEFGEGEVGTREEEPPPAYGSDAMMSTAVPVGVSGSAGYRPAPAASYAATATGPGTRPGGGGGGYPMMHSQPQYYPGAAVAGTAAPVSAAAPIQYPVTMQSHGMAGQHMQMQMPMQQQQQQQQPMPTVIQSSPAQDAPQPRQEGRRDKHVRYVMTGLSSLAVLFLVIALSVNELAVITANTGQGSKWTFTCESQKFIIETKFDSSPSNKRTLSYSRLCDPESGQMEKDACDTEPLAAAWLSLSIIALVAGLVGCVSAFMKIKKMWVWDFLAALLTLIAIVTFYNISNKLCWDDHNKELSIDKVEMGA